jgi:hypothetical protein
MQRIRSDRDEPPEYTSTGRGIGRRDAVPPDGEKIHLGAALSFAIIENGRRVLFTRTTDLV